MTVEDKVQQGHMEHQLRQRSGSPLLAPVCKDQAHPCMQRSGSPLHAKIKLAPACRDQAHPCMHLCMQG